MRGGCGHKDGAGGSILGLRQLFLYLDCGGGGYTCPSYVKNQILYIRKSVLLYVNTKIKIKNIF